ncbi:MAG: hypothetical protein GWN29_05020 [Gammaproteobacteria bacterium]|nr:hypothetical protein [Gammaproteobacteria bacterium]NIV51115.1 hypothetical protein [Gammaproteobacteria bacterium]NIW23968.1 hypothetical protein [Gammaproteobacteria bacterium]NIX85057.1 hypothetical protein [Gammaproteobacteria bacterium]
MSLEIANHTYNCHATDNGWRFGLYLDPEARRVSHWAMFGPGAPPSVGYGRARIVDLPRGAVGEHVEGIVRSEEFRALAEALCDLYDGAEWDGSNHVGVWSDPDRAAELEQELEALFAIVPTYWLACDWMSQTWHAEEAAGIRARLAEGESLGDIASEAVEDATRHDAYLDHDDVVSTLEALLAEFPAESEANNG